MLLTCCAAARLSSDEHRSVARPQLCLLMGPDVMRPIQWRTPGFRCWPSGIDRPCRTRSLKQRRQGELQVCPSHACHAIHKLCLRKCIYAAEPVLHVAPASAQFAARTPLARLATRNRSCSCGPRWWHPQQVCARHTAQAALPAPELRILPARQQHPAATAAHRFGGPPDGSRPCRREDRGFCGGSKPVWFAAPPAICPQNAHNDFADVRAPDPGPAAAATR